MPYKDPARQREYVRTWRRNQKLRTSRTPAQHIVHSEPAYHRKFPLPAVPRTPPSVDQLALKMSPDGAPQTGREATQSYRINSSQRTTSRISPKTTPIRQSPVVFPKTTRQRLAMPIASIVVEVLSRFF